MSIITLKRYFINKAVYWLLALAAASMTLIFAAFDIPREDRFILSVCIIGAETYFVLFLNRFEAKFIKFDEEKFEIGYINYKYFEKPDRLCTRNDTTVLNKHDALLLSNKDGVIGKIRKKSVSAENWAIIENYFI